MHSYNTTQAPLKLKEYGRNVQKLVMQLAQVSDKVTRTHRVNAILKIMELLYTGHTGAKPTLDNSPKYWDDLMIISDYKLDIDSSYSPPASDLLAKRPQPLNYPQKKVKYRHCGRHIEQLVQQAVAIADPAHQEAMIIHIGKLIKNLSATWNKDNMDNETIFGIIQDLAGKKLVINIEKLKSENNFTTHTNNRVVPKDKKQAHYRRENRTVDAR